MLTGSEISAASKFYAEHVEPDPMGGSGVAWEAPENFAQFGHAKPCKAHFVRRRNKQSNKHTKTKKKSPPPSAATENACK